MDMVISNKVSCDGPGNERPALPLPLGSRKIYWHAEKNLNLQEIEKYRNLLGHCSPDCSHSYTDVDRELEVQYHRSTSVASSHN